MLSLNGEETKAEGKRKSVLPPRPPVDLMAELNALRLRLGAFEVHDTEEVGGGQKPFSLKVGE